MLRENRFLPLALEVRTICMRGGAYSSVVFDAGGDDDTGSGSDAPVEIDSVCVGFGLSPSSAGIEPVSGAPVVATGVVPRVRNPDRL